MSYRSTVDAPSTQPQSVQAQSVQAGPSASSRPSPLFSDSAHGAPRSAPAVACFHVVAEAHPGTIGRLLQVVAKRGLVPSYLHSVLGGREGNELAVDLQVAGLDDATRTLVAAQLRAVITVRTVLTSVKSFAG